MTNIIKTYRNQLRGLSNLNGKFGLWLITSLKQFEFSNFDWFNNTTIKSNFKNRDCSKTIINNNIQIFSFSDLFYQKQKINLINNYKSIFNFNFNININPNDFKIFLNNFNKKQYNILIIDPLFFNYIVDYQEIAKIIFKKFNIKEIFIGNLKCFCYDDFYIIDNNEEELFKNEQDIPGSKLLTDDLYKEFKKFYEENDVFNFINLKKFPKELKNNLTYDFIFKGSLNKDIITLQDLEKSINKKDILYLDMSGIFSSFSESTYNLYKCFDIKSLDIIKFLEFKDYEN